MIIKELVDAWHKLGRQIIIIGLLLLVAYLAHIESSALDAMVVLAVAAVQTYFQLKGSGKNNE